MIKARAAGGSCGGRPGDLGSDELVQATANDAAQGKLAAATLGYFRDPFIGFFARKIGATESSRRLPPVINRGNFARVLCVEKLVLEYLAPEASSAEMAGPSLCKEGGVGDANIPCSTTPESNRKPQVVSLGAGKDSLFFRLKENGRAPAGGYFEVDFDAISAWKARIIGKTPTLSALAGQFTEPSDDETHDNSEDATSTCPGSYHLVTADLRDTKGLEEGLKKAGVDFSAPTVFLAECVLVYMEAKESAALLQWCSKSFPHSMFAAFEMTGPGDAFGKMMQQNIQRMGCLLPGLEPYPSLETQELRFCGSGWDSARAADMLDIFQNYLDRDEVQRASKIEVLDEIEEWELIMRHYCFVVAAKGPGAARRLNEMSLSPQKGS